MKKNQINELNKVTKNLLCAVLPEHIIYIQNNRVFLGGKELTMEQGKNLVAEAKFLESSQLWQIFQGTLTETARKTMFENSKSFDDLICGKLLLYNLDIIKTIVTRLIQIENNQYAISKRP